MIFAVDFDGTCVTPNFPKLGVDIGAAPVLKKLQSYRHKIFVWTLRGTKPNHYNGSLLNEPLLQDVYRWEIRNNFKFDGYNQSLVSQDWTDSPKQFADFYIDDMSLGCPLMAIKNKLCVDWYAIVSMLRELGIFNSKDCQELQVAIDDEIELNKFNYERLCI